MTGPSERWCIGMRSVHGVAQVSPASYTVTWIQYDTTSQGFGAVVGGLINSRGIAAPPRASFSETRTK